MTTTAREVELKDLHLEHAMWANPRTTTGLGSDDLDDLAASIKERGILVPLEVLRVKNEDGGVIDLVVDGQRRVLAAKLAGFKGSAPIPVVDAREDTLEFNWHESDGVFLDMLSIAVQRVGLSSFELSEAAERLKNRGKNGEEIARAINKSASWVSRMLKARASADPKILAAWKAGKLTDEVFKDLSDVATAKQSDALDDYLGVKKSDRGGARAMAKEAKAKTVKNGHAKHKPVVSGEQKTLFEDDHAEAKAKKNQPPRKDFLEELVALSEKRTPTSDYVKGIMDGVGYTLGTKQLDEFSPAWAKYVNRVGGSATTSFSSPKAKKGKAKGKISKPTKARKPSKKSAKKKR
ncbi:MAG TPA: ParB N-terminal domain-containing protein [Galbitalea sp.]|jgi:ParB/RepB/Spo0J family partition protein